MSVMEIDCLFSTVKNISGAARTFSFLPPHGRKLAANEEFSMLGEVTEAVVRMDRVTSQRQLNALAASIAAGNLAILQTPSPILQSVNGTISKMIQLSAGGQLVAVDPCFHSASFSGRG